MLTHTNLKKGIKIILDKEPYEVLEAQFLKKAQRRPIVQTKIKNLITGSVFDKNFHQGDTFEEAEILRLRVKYLYNYKENYFFCHENDPAKRFDLTQEQIGPQSKFLKQNQVIEALLFNDKAINIILPIKVNLKVVEAPPGIKGDRAQGGTKTVTLETKAHISAPLFIKEGDMLEINTETEEYVRRIE